MSRWIIVGGYISSRSKGEGPDFISKDYLSILNVGDKTNIHLHIYHPDQEPVGPYEFQIEKRRVCKIILNDLIAPQALILEEPYSIVIESNGNIIVQFTRQDTCNRSIAICGGIPYSQA